MKIIIELKETKRGDVEMEMWSDGASSATRKEVGYAITIKDYLLLEIPKMCKRLGGFGVIADASKLSNQ